MAITLLVNGTEQQVNVEPEKPLLSVLRDDLGLTGTKYGCGEGQCGACTVLIDGVPTRTCNTHVESVAQKKITTIESLAPEGKLHPLQQAFLKVDAMQCGYCTAGMIVSALGLLQKNPNPSEREIIRGMNGNICRCGTYRRILAAIQEAATAMREGGAK